MLRKPKTPSQIVSLKHKEAKRTNIPTAEYQSVMQKEEQASVKVAYARDPGGMAEEKAQRNHSQTGEVRSDDPGGIACWLIDTDYNEESFFVRQVYFLGANDPYKVLTTILKAEINEDAWATLNGDSSRPFPKPKSGRIALNVINHLGDEVMKVLQVI